MPNSPESDYTTGILDIQAADAASVYSYGPRPGQQQACVFATLQGGIRNTNRDWLYSSVCQSENHFNGILDDEYISKVLNKDY